MLRLLSQNKSKMILLCEQLFVMYAEWKFAEHVIRAQIKFWFGTNEESSFNLSNKSQTFFTCAKRAMFITSLNPRLISVAITLVYNKRASLAREL